MTEFWRNRRSRLISKKQVSTALKRLKLQTSQREKWADRRLTEKAYNKAIANMKFGKRAIGFIEKGTLGNI
jgi:hypothetical protein